MIRECHLLFKGSLKLLLAKQYDTDRDCIEPECSKCDQINHFVYDPKTILQKQSEETPRN